MTPRGFHILRQSHSPWGDYGDILVSGMGSHLSRKDGQLQLERTGPFVPPITFPGPGAIVVTAALRRDLEASDLRGFAFAPLIKARIVRLDWQIWDLHAPRPKDLPPSGEPEDYILARRHSPELADALGPLWELVPDLGGTVVRGAVDPRTRRTEIRLRPSGDADIFRADGVGFTYVNTRMKAWLTERAEPWVCFEDALLVLD